MRFLSTITFRPGDGFAADLRREILGSKVVHLRRTPPGADVPALYTSLLRSMGRLVKKGERIDEPAFVDNEWLDVRYDREKAHTFRHSNTRQPLHTDGAYIADFPCDIVFLCCLEQADSGGETVFLDADDLVRRLEAEDPELLAELEATPIVFGKGAMGSKTERGLYRQDGAAWCNWNHFRVAEDNPPAVKSLAERFQQFLEHRIFAQGIPTAIRLAPGEAVFFHDRRVLHGRNSFTGERCLIKGVLDLPPGNEPGAEIAPC